MALALTAENLHIQRGGRAVIEAVAFVLNAGDAMILTGPNGAGKTTLLRAIAGFLKPSSGTMFLVDGDPELTIGQQCHYAGHLDAVKSKLTVGENLTFWSDFCGGDTGTVTEALAAFDLEDLAHVPAAYLSAGQRRRLGLARLLAAHRPLWLLDEPTVSLDAASRERFAGIVAAHLRRGGIAIAATHVDLGLGTARQLRLGVAGIDGIAA